MIDYSDFFEEVIQTHVEIEQWFAGVAPEGTLQSLLARFSPEFSMAGIDRHARGATVTYREHQIDASGTQTDRRATVVFEKQASGALLWRHLHETFVPQARNN
jgi:hypothetical protein